MMIQLPANRHVPEYTHAVVIPIAVMQWLCELR